MMQRALHPSTAAMEAAPSIEQIRRECAERARCPRLQEGEYLSLHVLAGKLGINRSSLRGELDNLTWRREDGYKSAIEIKVDEQLEALCTRWFVNVKIGDRPPTLSMYPGHE